MMKKIRTFLAGAAALASVASCSPDSTQTDKTVANSIKDLQEVIVTEASKKDVQAIKNFNIAIIENDDEKALYSLADAYRIRQDCSRIMYLDSTDVSKTKNNHNTVYHLLPQIKEFSLKFWNAENIKKFRDILDNNHAINWLWYDNWSLRNAMITILNAVETYQKGWFDKEFKDYEKAKY